MNPMYYITYMCVSYIYIYIYPTLSNFDSFEEACTSLCTHYNDTSTCYY